MAVYLDSADIEELKSLKSYPFVKGVTCNPSILSKTLNKNKIKAGDLYNYLVKLSKHSPGDIFMQTNCTRTEDIVKESEKIKKLIPKSIIKIPYTRDGLKAVNILKKKKIKTAVTAVFDAFQGYIAAESGADYAIPYCNRITRQGSDGVRVSSQIAYIIEKHNLETRVLAASVKSVKETEDLLLAGVKDITLSFDMIAGLTEHKLSAEAEEKFQKSMKIT
ncbi:MAG: transaldolase family protein [Armatimonadota bacterium]